MRPWCALCTQILRRVSLDFNRLLFSISCIDDKSISLRLFILVSPHGARKCRSALRGNSADKPAATEDRLPESRPGASSSRDGNSDTAQRAAAVYRNKVLTALVN